jgi:predicted nuclease of restriction endonuclease-like (RecB) superfamily
VRAIEWSHNIAISGEVQGCAGTGVLHPQLPQARWSLNILIHQIENQAFCRTMSSQTNFARILEPDVSVRAQLAVKDEYTFAFLELEDEHS